MEDKKKKIKIGLKYYLNQHKVGVTFYVLLYIVLAVTGFLVTYKTAEFLDLLSNSDLEKAIVTIIIILAISLFTTLMDYICALIFFKLSNKISLQLKKDLAHRFLQINIESIERTSSGLIINRIDNDPETLIVELDTFTYRVSMILNLLLSISYIAVINIYIGMFIFGIVVFTVVFEFVRLKIFKNKLKHTKKLSEPATSITTEMVKSQKDIKTLGLEKQFESTFEKHYSIFKKATENRQVVNYSLVSVEHTVMSILIYGLIILSVFMLKDYVIALASVLFIFTNRQAIQNFGFFVGLLGESISKCKVACERIFEVYDEESYQLEHYGNKDVDLLKGDIEFKNVGFVYVDKKEKEQDQKAKKRAKKEYEITEQRVFENLSFKIQQNSTVALIGESGSGKSTILNLIAKLADATEGEVLIDGYNIQDLSKKTLRDNIVLVNQFPYIFDMNIRENIRLAKPTATDEEILQACKDANLLEYVESLEEGLDTKVGESGVKMSGGQKQRLAIARALIKDSAIIIFDESTSSLDNISQAEITKSINKFSGTRTVIIVAHRLSTIKNVDTIYYLDQGKIVDKGTFDELYSRNEKIKKLFLAENID